MNVQQLANTMAMLTTEGHSKLEAIFLTDDGETYDVIDVEYDDEEKCIYLRGEHT